MANFIFNPIKVKMCDGSGGFDWLAENVVGILYDNRLTVGPNMFYAGVEAFIVATSGSMSGRTISAEGAMMGSTLEFLNVVTQPGLRIKGLILSYTPSNVLIANFTDGLDGFTGNNDLNIEANNINIYARTSAANQGTWIAL